jgi:hypothetical protein
MNIGYRNGRDVGAAVRSSSFCGRMVSGYRCHDLSHISCTETSDDFRYISAVEGEVRSR